MMKMKRVLLKKAAPRAAFGFTGDVETNDALFHPPLVLLWWLELAGERASKNEKRVLFWFGGK